MVIMRMMVMIYDGGGGGGGDGGGDNDDDDDDVNEVENGRGVGEDVKAVMRRLTELLIEQEREMEEMKKRHRRAVADLLKEIPSELKGSTLGLHGLDI